MDHSDKKNATFFNEIQSGETEISWPAETVANTCHWIVSFVCAGQN
jgi:hypothetical protein